MHVHRLRYEHDVLPGLSHLVLSAPILSSGLAFVGLQVLAGAVSKLVFIPWRKDRSRGCGIGEVSWALQALAFELLDTVLDLTGSVDGE